MLLVAANPTTAALGLFNIGRWCCIYSTYFLYHTYIHTWSVILSYTAGLYAGVYTYSKQHTELNTWIGSVVGAVPPLMGWAAATGSIPSRVLFMLMWHEHSSVFILRMYVCMYVCMHICNTLRVHIYDVCMYACMYACWRTYIHTCIYTYIHTS